MAETKSGILMGADPKLFIMLAGLLILWVVFVSIVPQELKPAPEDNVIVSFKATAGGQVVLDASSYVEKGTNAFEEMQTLATVGYLDYGSLGVMVQSINGVKPGENEFWKLYVNGKEAAAGISSITIEEDTEIEWKTESVESYTG